MDNPTKANISGALAGTSSAIPMMVSERVTSAMLMSAVLDRYLLFLRP
jgi:hypothetical protein